jgi:hypothetical protein
MSRATAPSAAALLPESPALRAPSRGRRGPHRNVPFRPLGGGPSGPHGGAFHSIVPSRQPGPPAAMSRAKIPAAPTTTAPRRPPAATAAAGRGPGPSRSAHGWQLPAPVFGAAASAGGDDGGAAPQWQAAQHAGAAVSGPRSRVSRPRGDGAAPSAIFPRPGVTAAAHRPTSGGGGAGGGMQQTHGSLRPFSDARAHPPHRYAHLQPQQRQPLAAGRALPQWPSREQWAAAARFRWALRVRGGVGWGGVGRGRCSIT